MPKKATSKPKITKAGAKVKGILSDAGAEPTQVSGPLDFAEMFGKAMVKVIEKSPGGKSITDFDGNIRASLVGLRLPHFMLEVMLSESVLNLGRVFCFDGMHETCKSAMMWEFTRLFDINGGAACIIDTEQKATENLGQGLLGYDRWPNVQFVTAETFEEVMRIITGMVQVLKDNANKTGKKNLPLILGIDSLQGAASEGESKKIREKGAAGRSFSDVALLSSKYLPELTAMISNMPILVAFVRHDRKVNLDSGIQTQEAKGGGEMHFAAYKTFRMQKWKDINKVGSGGKSLLIKLLKGTGEGIKIPIDFEWRDKMVGKDASLRHFTWNWPNSLYAFLSKPVEYKIPTRIINSFHEIIGPMNVVQGKANCKPLGLQKATAVEFEEALYDPTNRHILEGLRAAFCIRIGQEFTYGDDFDEKKKLQRDLVIARRCHVDTVSPAAMDGFEGETGEPAESGEE